jgi:hypothetical protein
MRAFLLATLILLTSVCSAATIASLRRAANDDELIERAGVALHDVQFRLPCWAAIIDSDDPPEFFDCVYVQSENELNVLAYEGGYLVSELQLKMRSIDGIALLPEASLPQLQIFSHRRITVIHFFGKGFFRSPKNTQVVYDWLKGHGVAGHAPARAFEPREGPSLYDK